MIGGRVTEAFRFGTEALGCGESLAVAVELAQGVWHTLPVAVADSILFQVKAGPFDPTLAKRLAAWSPADGSAARSG